MAFPRHWGRRPLACLVMTSLVLVVTGAPAHADDADGKPLPSTGDANYIVRYKKGVDARSENSRQRSRGRRLGPTLTRVFPGALMTLSSAERASVARDPDVAYVEPVRPVQASTTQTDAPWGLDRIDQTSTPLTRTYTYGPAGQGVDVYIIDSGINLSHADFEGRIDTARAFYADDLGETVDDCDGHGTHVAGIAAGTRYGVAKRATIIPFRVLDCQGSGFSDDVIVALDEIAKQHADGQPAVANLSLGGAFSPAMNDAVAALVADGVTVVVAAGNERDDACAYSPAAAEQAIAVGATTADDALAAYSNTGSCVDMLAPGSSIRSASIGSSTGSVSMNGTSMAAPHVAGAAALILTWHPSWAPAKVRKELLTTALSGTISGLPSGTPNRLLHTVRGVTPVAMVAKTPAVSGTPRTDATLTVVPGSWLPTDTRVAYQWYRTSSSGAREPISGGTGATYRVQPADVGYRFFVSVTGSATGYGSATRTSALTTATVKATLKTATPTFSRGAPRTDVVLTAQPGAWTSGTSFAYQWYKYSSSGTKYTIKGATNATYTVRAADVRYRLRVRVRGSKPGYHTKDVYSAKLVTTHSQYFTKGSVSVIGTARVGQTLTGTTTGWSPSPSLSYQWYRYSTAGTKYPVTGATSPTYTVRSSDRRYTLKLRVRATHAGYFTAYVYSPATAAVS